MTTERAVQLYSMRRECKDRQCAGSTAALNDGLFLTTVSETGVGDFVCLSLFISSNSLDGY